MTRRDLIEDGLSREEFSEERVARLIDESGMRDVMRFYTREERKVMRRDTLGNVAGKDVWIFAYGSLMWNPAMHTVERRSGLIHGYHRRFCLRVAGGRGTLERPGLMLGLDRGGSCRGIVWRIAAAEVESETEILWRREQVTDGYLPRWVKVHTPQGVIRAITFIASRTQERYVRDLEESEVVRMMATAKGHLGRARDYLHNTVLHLDELGIAEGSLHRLLEAVDAYEEGAGEEGAGEEGAGEEEGK